MSSFHSALKLVKVKVHHLLLEERAVWIFLKEGEIEDMTTKQKSLINALLQDVKKHIWKNHKEETKPKVHHSYQAPGMAIELMRIITTLLLEKQHGK